MPLCRLWVGKSLSLVYGEENIARSLLFRSDCFEKIREALTAVEIASFALYEY